MNKFNQLDTLEVELVKQEVMTKEELINCRKIMDNSGRTMVEVLKKNYSLSEKKLYEVVAKGFGVEYKSMDEFSNVEIPEFVLNSFDSTVALDLCAMPIERTGNKIKVLVINPLDYEIKSRLEQKSGKMVQLVLCKEEDIKNLIWLYYKDKKARSNVESLARQVAKESNGIEIERANLIRAKDNVRDLNPASLLLNQVFELAAYKRASDIHISPYADKGVIRLRVDGHLEDLVKEIPLNACAGIIMKIMVHCGMKVDEKRKGHDGVLNYEGADGTMLELRVSIIPLMHGLSAVMRVVDKNSVNYTIDTLGLQKRDRNNFESYINSPYGLILVTGPTGSGKTTTLYTALRKLIKDNPHLNIITVEDPIEQQLDGIQQIQLKADIGYDFSSALRNILRHDPDIVLIGEIRDKETAEIAVKAAATGHLVLSTLHTNDAVSAVYRMYDIGIEPFLLSGVLNGCIAQRLVRKVCNHCSFDREITVSESLNIGIPESTIVKTGKGCALCGNTGYLGRIAVYETVSITDDMRIGITERDNVVELKRIAEKQGMKSMQDNCRDLVIEGITTPQEAIQILFSKT